MTDIRTASETDACFMTSTARGIFNFHLPERQQEIASLPRSSPR
jgi:hypothetical protein